MSSRVTGGSGKGRGKGRRTHTNPLPAILAAAISRAKSPALREWLTALASDRATGTNSAELTRAGE